MPDGKVTIAITADASGVQRGAQQADQALTGIEKKASSGLGFGLMAGVGAKAFDLISGAAGQAVQALGQAVDVGSKFEAQMSKVEAISKASATDMALLTDKAKELGSSTAFSASEAGQAFEYMAMAGWKTSEMLDGVEGIMDLAAASGEDLAKTSDIVTDALTAFGLKAKDSGKFADVLAAASSNANTDVSKLGESFKQVAPVAGALGYSVEDISAALGLMANAGIKGGAAGTALRATLSRLSKPTKETREAMEKLGVSLTDGEGNLLSFRDIMLNMRSGFSALSEGERSAAAAMLGGQEAMSGLLAIVNASDSDFEKLTNAIDNSNGAAKDMADTMQDNLQGSLTRFGSAAEGLGIAVYDAIKTPLAGLVDFGATVIGGITGLLTREKSDLEMFLDEVAAHGKTASDALAGSYDAIAKGEAQVGKLTAYKKVLLEVVEAGKANEYQAYMVEKILAEMGDELPNVAAAWDAETKSLKMNKDALEKDFDQRIKLAKMDAIGKAQEEAARAVGEAYVAREMAASAEAEAVKRLNEQLGTSAESWKDLISADRDWEEASEADRRAAAEAANAVEKYSTEMDKATAREEDLARMAERAERELLGVSDAAGDAAGANAQNAEEAQAAAEATERLSEAARRVTDSYTTASDTVKKAFDSIKSSLESAFSVNLFESWDTANQKSAWNMVEALEQQETALKAYKENMEKLQAGLAGEKGADAFLARLAELGPQGARAVAEFAGNIDLAKRAAADYGAAFDASEAVMNALALTNAALVLGLNELQSTPEEWEGLERAVLAAVSMPDVDAAIADGLNAAIETAQALGVAIPKGLAESILSSDDPATAIETAAESLNNAILGHTESVVKECEKLGLDVPASIKAGIEAGGAEAEQAFADLLALMGGSDALQKAKETGKQGGEKASEGQAEGVKAKEKDVVAASQQNAQAAAEAVRGEKFSMAAAGQELSTAGAGGVMSTILRWTEAGANISRGLASGIQSGRSLVINAAVQTAVDSYAAAKAALDEHSPSRVYRDIGYMAAKGWALGMTDGAALVTDASQKIAESALTGTNKAAKKMESTFDKMRAALQKGADKGRFASSFETASATATKTIENATKTAEDALKTAASRYFTGLSDANAAKLEKLQAQQDRIREQYNATQDKTLRESLNAQEKALKAEIDGLRKRQTKISKLSGEFASTVLTAYNKALDGQADKITNRLTTALEEAAKTAQTQIDALNGKIASMKSGLLGIGTTWDGATFGKGLIQNVKNQISGIQSYEKQLKELERRGISKTLLSEITGMEAESGARYMSALLGLSDKDLKQYDKLFRKRAKEAQRVSNEHYADEVKAVKENYTDAITAAFEQAQKAIEGMGEQTMKGFLKGMKSSDYSREIRKIAKNIVSSMADELEIHSPSRKAESLAKAFSAGWDVGIERTTASTEHVMKGYAEDTLQAFKAALGTANGPRASFAAPDIRAAALPMAMASVPELASVPAASVGDKETRITLITTLDGREIARGTADYTEAELARRQTFAARREGYV